MGRKDGAVTAHFRKYVQIKLKIKTSPIKLNYKKAHEVIDIKIFNFDVFHKVPWRMRHRRQPKLEFSADGGSKEGYYTE